MVDPTSRASVAAALEVAKPDSVFHLAGVAVSPDLSVFYRVNVLYAATLLAAMEAAGLSGRQVVLVGSAAEYGPVAPEHQPIVEETPCSPTSHYGISKLAQTQLARAARASQRVLVVRPSNLVGPGMPANYLVPQLVEQVLAVQRGAAEVVNVGNLAAVRDFLDIEDACRALWRLSSADVPSGEIVNLCSGRGVAVREIVDGLLALAGGRIEVRVDPRRVGANDVPVHVGSTAKLERLVGRIDLVPLQETLRRVLAAST